MKIDVLIGAVQISLSSGKIMINTDRLYNDSLAVSNHNHLQRLLLNNTQLILLV